MSLIISVQSVATITAAMTELLRSHKDVGLAGVDVERAGEFPEDPGAHGWIGIYKTRQQLPPRAVGMGPGFRNQRVQIGLVAIESDPTSGELCEDRLETLVANTLGALLSDPSLGGTVSMLDDVLVEYESYNKDDSMFKQQAVIFVTAVTITNAVNV